MSFVIGKSTEDLETEINNAARQSIVMTCSTHDEGSRIEKAFPVSFKKEAVFFIVLAACDEYGRALQEVDEQGCHYLILGRKVAAGGIPFLKSEDIITGSSVATAPAAGLCSLVLTCDRLAHPGKKYMDGMGPYSRYRLV
jgi:hypothetical protein